MNVDAEDLWIVTDTRFGFIDYRGKRIMDRIMPILNMNIEIRDGWMRHQLRYHALNVGVLYHGEGNQELLEEWCERCAKNLGGKSLGVISLDKTGKEVASISCGSISTTSGLPSLVSVSRIRQQRQAPSHSPMP